jgi:hypothetical protein
VQPREGQLHLGLDTRRPRHAASVGRRGYLSQERGLPDARLTAQDQHVAFARADTRNESIELHAFADAIKQTGRPRLGVGHDAGDYCGARGSLAKACTQQHP